MKPKPIGWHVIIRLRDDRILTPTVTDRRRFASIILRVGQPFGLLLFSVAGTHAHAVVLCSEADAGRFARRLCLALHHALAPGVPFETHRKTRIENQRHLRHLRTYIFDNARKHGTDADPFHEATNLPDLLGLRVTGAYTRKLVRERLPSVKRADLLAHLGLEELGEGGDLARLADAAAAAVAEPTLGGRRPIIVRARVAAARIGLEHGTHPARLAEQLAVTERTIRNLARPEPDPWLTRAIRHQLWLRDRLAETTTDRSRN